MKLLFFGYIIIANLQFYDANQIEFGEWYNSFLELSKNMTEVMNRLNKIEKDNVELKQDNLVLKRENIELKNETAQLKNQVQTLESDMDIILRKNGKDFHSCYQYFEHGITKNGYYYIQESNTISQVYCEFEGMDEQHNRYLIVGGRSHRSAEEVEIVDLSDPTKNCSLLDDIQPRKTWAYAGGLLGQSPVICQTDECIVFGTTQKQIAMTQRRNLYSAVSLNSSTLWLLGKEGGHHRRGYYFPGGETTEFISLSEGAINGPKMPAELYLSCVVKYNETTIYIMGGYKNDNVNNITTESNNVWIATISDTITFSQGPSMLQGRFFHACSTFSVGNKKLIIVTGGLSDSKSREKFYSKYVDYSDSEEDIQEQLLQFGPGISTEILDPSVNQWVEGPNLPFKVYGSQMVTSPDGNGIILIGGGSMSPEGNMSEKVSKKLLQLKRDANGWASSWTTMKHKLRYSRVGHVAIPISYDLTTCK